LLALSQFEISPEGKVLPKPGPALVEILTRKDGAWHTQKIEDEESNVFHKAMVYAPPGKAPGILTLGGNAGSVKLWRRSDSGFDAEVLYDGFGGEQPHADGGWSSSMATQVTATHDQVVTPRPPGVVPSHRDDRRRTRSFDRDRDLDGDGVEVYATPSEPNCLTAQRAVRWCATFPESGRAVSS
jgi:hypothetical protein